MDSLDECLVTELEYNSFLKYRIFPWGEGGPGKLEYPKVLKYWDT